MSVKEKMTAIADKIRDWTHKGGLLTLDDMPDAIQQACELSYCDGEGVGYSNGWSDGWDIGYADGESAGIDIGYTNGYFDGESAGFSNGQAEGFAQGEQAEYDRFWDIMQDNGKRTNYNYAFCGSGWLDSTYNPKYPIAPTACTQLYYSSKITDTKVPIDLTKTGSNHTYLFTYCNNLVTINKLIVNETRKFTDTFASCTALKNITIEGTIGRDINLQWSPLTLESALSVVNHLYNYTGESGRDTYTITLNSSVWALLDAWMQEQPVLGELYSTAREWIECELCWLTA